MVGQPISDYSTWSSEERSQLDDRLMEITEEGLDSTRILFTLYAGNPQFTKEWREIGVSKAIEEYSLMKASGRQLTEVSVETLQDTWKITYSPEDHTLEVNIQIGNVELPDGYRNRFDSQDEFLRWKSDVVQTAINQTLVSIAESFAESDFTSREFLAYHLRTSFDSDETAAILTKLYGSEQSAGTARKQASRAQEKLQKAATTVDLTKERKISPVVDLPRLETVSESPVTDEQKTDIYHTLHRELNTTDVDSQTPLRWEIEPEMTTVFRVTDQSLEFHTYYHISDLPTTITVDDPHVESDQIDTDGEISVVSDLGSDYYLYLRDIDDILEELTGEPVERFTIHSPPKAISAHPASADRPAVVEFYGTFPTTRIESGSDTYSNLEKRLLSSLGRAMKPTDSG
jgi:hypothetical protein